MSDDDATFAAGVALACCCSALNSAGMGLQKLAHRRLEALPERERGAGALVRDRGWRAGLLCMALASILSLGNFALLGQSRAAAMASLTIVSNAVMARTLLRETLTPLDAASTALIGSGIVVAVVFGSSGGGAPRTSLDDVLALLRRDVVYAAGAAIVAALGAAEAYLRYAERLGARASPAARKLECFARAFVAGLFSGCTGFLAKCVVVSVESMVAARSAADLSRFELWLLGLSLPLSIAMQLRYLNGGLRRFDAMDIVPMYQACIVTVGVAWGWTFFEENRYLEPFDEQMFAVGVGVSVLGIGVLSFKGASASAAGAGAGAGAGAAGASGGAAGVSFEGAPLLGGDSSGGSGPAGAAGGSGGSVGIVEGAAIDALGAAYDAVDKGSSTAIMRDRGESLIVDPAVAALSAAEMIAGGGERGRGGSGGWLG